ncbi:MAG: hypothetical protein HY397_00965 [Candidatus Doudnabacteria bacterium]|nr:hypothetical protein [Candidatus Doudnabacteria bacterium]
MSFFSLKSQDGRRFGSRFREKIFQQKIRAARVRPRFPKVSPRAQTNLSLSKTFRGTRYLAWIIALGVLSGSYFFLTSDFFVVKQIEVSDTAHIKAVDVVSWFDEQKNSKFFGLVPKNHLLLLNKGNVAGLLKSRSAQILEISSFARVWPDKIIFSFTERLPIAIWRSVERYYYVSSDFVLSEELPAGYATATDAYVIFSEHKPAPVAVGEKLDIQRQYNFVADLQKDWSAKIGIRIKEVTFPDKNSPDLFVESNTGWIAYFDVDASFDAQLRALELVLKRQIPLTSIDKLAYIDLRLINTIYYCFRGEPCAAITSPIENLF